MKKLLLILVLTLPVINSYAIGWGDWQRDTPYGNYMYDAGGGTRFVFKKPYQELADIQQWYFYKGHTIGQYGKGYFIADEKTGRLQTFSQPQEWQTTLSALNLKPTWTRWYQDDWHFFDDLLLIMVLAFYISIPVLIVLAAVVYSAVINERLNPKKPCTFVVLGITAISAVQYYLEVNPISM